MKPKLGPDHPRQPKRRPRYVAKHVDEHSPPMIARWRAMKKGRSEEEAAADWDAYVTKLEEARAKENEALRIEELLREEAKPGCRWCGGRGQVGGISAPAEARGRPLGETPNHTQVFECRCTGGRIHLAPTEHPAQIEAPAAEPEARARKPKPRDLTDFLFGDPQ